MWMMGLCALIAAPGYLKKGPRADWSMFGVSVFLAIGSLLWSFQASSDYLRDLEKRRAEFRSAQQGRPSLVITWVPGYVLNPIRNEFEVAIWPDGRILWRDTPIVWSKGPKGWSLSKGNYLESKIDPERVETLMDEIRGRDLFSKESWSRYWPDTSFMRVSLQDGPDSTVISSMPAAPRPGPGDADDIAVYQTYTWVRSKARELIPSKGKPVKRPGAEEQRRWVKP
jgi:hypothetical protein